MNLNREQLAIMEHTDTRAAGRVYCGDSPDMQVLVAEGLMEYAGRKSFAPDQYFRLTRKGSEALKLAHFKRENLLAKIHASLNAGHPNPEGYCEWLGCQTDEELRKSRSPSRRPRNDLAVDRERRPRGADVGHMEERGPPC